MISVNAFGQRMCDKNCPAYFNDDECLEFCRAGFDGIGRESVDGEMQLVELCGLPVGFKLVVNE